MRQESIHIVVYGDVQGVFFRDLVQKTATTLGVTGFVRNRKDGTLEVVAEGSREKLEELLGVCATGPDLALIDSVEEKWGIAEGRFHDFSIQY